MSIEVMEDVDTIGVCFYIFFPSGGIGRYTNALMRTLSSSGGVSVEAVCSPDFRWRHSAAYSTWPELRSISHRIPPIRRLRFLMGQFSNPIRCVDHAAESGAAIIHFSNINHLSFPFWKRRLDGTGLRVAVTVHDVRRRKAIVNRSWETAQLKAFYNFADALFVHSYHQATELVEFAAVPRDRIHIVPHGPYEHGQPTGMRNQLRARMDFGPHEEIALFFGNIRDDKNLDGLIKALRHSGSRPHLIIAGRSESRHRDIAYYQQLAEAHGVGDRTTFISRYVPDDEVADLFTVSDWVALPYRETFTSQSGVLNVATQYRRPVLVSSAPVLKETVEGSCIGVVAKDDSARAIAQGIDEISRRSRDGSPFDFDSYQQRFSWEQNARRTLEVYRDLVSRR